MKKARKRRIVPRFANAEPVDDIVQVLVLFGEEACRVYIPHSGAPYIEKAAPAGDYSLRLKWGIGEKRPLSLEVVEKLIRFKIIQKIDANMPDTDIFCITQVGWNLAELHQRFRKRTQGKSRP